MAELSPVETLRAAAAKLRELSKDATKGPICVDWMRSGIRHLERNCQPLCEHDECTEPGRYDGPWYALVHPGLAEPLADWLEHCYRTYRGWLTWPLEAQQAYAVARVLLGVPDGQ